MSQKGNMVLIVLLIAAVVGGYFVYNHYQTIIQTQLVYNPQPSPSGLLSSNGSILDEVSASSIVQQKLKEANMNKSSDQKIQFSIRKIHKNNIVEAEIDYIPGGGHSLWLYKKKMESGLSYILVNRLLNVLF